MTGLGLGNLKTKAAFPHQTLTTPFHDQVSRNARYRHQDHSRIEAGAFHIKPWSKHVIQCAFHSLYIETALMATVRVITSSLGIHLPRLVDRYVGPNARECATRGGMCVMLNDYDYTFAADAERWHPSHSKIPSPLSVADD